MKSMRFHELNTTMYFAFLLYFLNVHLLKVHVISDDSSHTIVVVMEVAFFSNLLLGRIEMIVTYYDFELS